jgi:hypothetical protein
MNEKPGGWQVCRRCGGIEDERGNLIHTSRVLALVQSQVIEIERLTEFCTHAGILKAQEEHNRMMGEKEAEILLLKSIICRHLKYYPATDVIVIRNDMPPMTVDIRHVLVQVLKEME